MRIHQKVALSAAAAMMALGVGVAGASYPGGGSDGQSMRQGNNGTTVPNSANYAVDSWTARLTRNAEVNDAGTPGVGDPDAVGVATFQQVGPATVCYGFTVNGTDTPTKVHIHQGEIGTNGPPVIEFANVPKDPTGQPSGNPGTSSGCKNLTPPEAQALAGLSAQTQAWSRWSQQARKLSRQAQKWSRRGGVWRRRAQRLISARWPEHPEPLGYYANIHTQQFPMGAVRGQLAPIAIQEPLQRLP